MEIGDAPGALHDILRFFWKYDLNITRIESRPSKQNALNQPRFDFYVDFEASSKDDGDVQKLLAALETKTTKVSERDYFVLPEISVLPYSSFVFC